MTIRPSGVLRSLAGLVGLVLVCAGAATAQESDNSFSAGVGVVSSLRIGANSSSSTSGSNSSSGSDNDTAAYLARGYTSTMDDDEQRLTIMSDTLLTESVCGGEPMVILKSSTIPANGACLKAQSHYNLSCACFSGFANATTWHFRIRSPDTAPKSPFPTVISVGDVVEVNSLMLDMSGNDISNLTVTNDELAIISQLAVFKVDVSSSFARVDCTSGELQEAHNTEFCVVNGSIPGRDNPDERRSQEQKILEKVALGSLRPTFYNDCPPGILALAASCLEGRPENRPSASEIVLTIKELMREIQLDNRPHPEPEPDDIATEGFLSTE
ncbi:hypothetical protein PRNP1_013879 [Phytophthora ramorum]